ncbi:fumarylacetoacetate hydrolase family protein [Paenibacillus sp.]|jgi:fumarylpyruvate hydrolase|uniref:fumarylacetoacetate hydrolase family protein n=1 Tax=Paenibacillus sp. TaxID=58172 RepID=UPI00281A746C|nr:fumarylacetoacetate hydrolase family protein [Paenibacillus sp.]MDR0270827.1 fumarylacetoacetate hydrolase family protein [Paenibacillus sp.]
MMIDQTIQVDYPKLEITGLDLKFPVSRVFGIGRNFSEKVESEQKNENNVVLFMKDAFMLSDADLGIMYPNNSDQLRYEIELVVAIGQHGKNIDPEEADDYIYGYGVGIDFTKYDHQDIAKKNGWPWDQGKSFEGCAPISSISKKEDFQPNANRIWLKKNDELVQDGTLGQMIWSVNEVVALISRRFNLQPGDLIFTGTPTGIGMVTRGDVLEGGVEGLSTIKVKVN